MCEEEFECVVVHRGEAIHQLLQGPHPLPLTDYTGGPDEVSIEVAGDEGVGEVLEELLEQAAYGVDVVIATSELGVVAPVYACAERVDEGDLPWDPEGLGEGEEKWVESRHIKVLMCMCVCLRR